MTAKAGRASNTVASSPTPTPPHQEAPAAAQKTSITLLALQEELGQIRASESPQALSERVKQLKTNLLAEQAAIALSWRTAQGLIKEFNESHLGEKIPPQQEFLDLKIIEELGAINSNIGSLLSRIDSFVTAKALNPTGHKPDPKFTQSKQHQLQAELNEQLALFLPKLQAIEATECFVSTSLQQMRATLSTIIQRLEECHNKLGLNLPDSFAPMTFDVMPSRETTTPPSDQSQNLSSVWISTLGLTYYHLRSIVSANLPQAQAPAARMTTAAPAQTAPPPASSNAAAESPDDF